MNFHRQHHGIIIVFVETERLSCLRNYVIQMSRSAAFKKRGSLATLLHDGHDHGGCSLSHNKCRSPESVALSCSRYVVWRLTGVHNHCAMKKSELTPTSFLTIQGAAFSSSLTSGKEDGSIGPSAEISCILDSPRSFFLAAFCVVLGAVMYKR